MQTKDTQGALSYLKDEAFKLSLFLIALYGLVFAVLQDPGQRQAVASSAFNEPAVSSTYSAPRNNVLTIPSLGVTAPLLAVTSTNPQDFTDPLKKGIAIFPSVLPGQKGTAIILGHSAPAGLPRTNYDWVFSDIQKLKQEDKVNIIFENKEYVYIVTETIFLRKGQEIPARYLAENESRILLVSCWPPGIDNKRIGVLARLNVF